MRSHAQRASRLLKAMSNERRLMVLCHLSLGERSVGELERLVGLSQSALSQHLARLRRDKLVDTRRDKQTIYYSLSSPEVRAIMGTVYEVFCGGQKKASAEPSPTDPNDVLASV